MTRRANRLGPRLSVLVLSLISPALAIAQDQDQNREPLRGPEVEQRDAPGVESPFVPGMTDPRMRAQRVPHQQFVRAIGSLAGDDAPAELRLDADSAQDIRAIAREYRESFRAYREEHAEEFAKLQPERDRSMTRQEARSRLTPEQRRRLRTLMQNAPKPDAAHARIWALLTEPQQEFVRAQLADSTRDERRMQGRPEPDQEPRLADPAEMMESDRARLEAIWQRIEELPPRARMQLLNRLENGLDRMEAERVREDRPPPSMDDVDVPSTD